jgi:hypothetical protein
MVTVNRLTESANQSIILIMTRCALSLVRYVMRYRSPVQYRCCVTRALGGVSTQDSFNSSLCFSGREALDTHLPWALYTTERSMRLLIIHVTGRSRANYQKYFHLTCSHPGHQGDHTGPGITGDARAADQHEPGSRRRACSGCDTCGEVDHS